MRQLNKSQQGVGMMEVLVAMLILAVGILGFVALQVRATVATDESLKRSDAILLLNGLAEKVRLNSTANYGVSIATDRPNCGEDEVCTMAEVNTHYCGTNGCDKNEQAKVDLFYSTIWAEQKDITIGTATCSNTSTSQQRLCLLAAWNNTDPVIGSATSESTCINSSTGRYLDDANCLVLEVY